MGTLYRLETLRRDRYSRLTASIVVILSVGVLDVSIFKKRNCMNWLHVLLT